MAAGRLHALHRGVFAVGHRAVLREGRWLAAVLACGDGAVLSHATAAAVWGIRRSDAATVDVAVASPGGRRRRAGIRVHRCAALRADEVTEHGDLPVTTPARTLLDLATLLTPRRLHRALDQAEALRLLDVAALHETADGRPGTPALREALATYAPDDIPTRSELEDRMLELCAAYGLPRPRVNTRVEGFEVDAFFAHAGLIVEADGFRHHGTRQAFERDRARDARLVAAGHRVLRVTHRRLVHDAPSVARELRRVLEAAPA